jgi:uncharacterized membrane protein
MEGVLRDLATRLALLVEAIAVLVVGVGSLAALVGLVRVQWQRAVHGARKEVWRRFGMWLLFGLEFELAADIIRSVFAPTWQDIGQLAAIAAIRTFLNYFLEKDLEQAEATASTASG